MQQAVYIGAGHDIIPVLIFRDIKKFIYIDSQPFSEHGTSVYTEKYISYESTLETREQYEADNLFGRPRFIEDQKDLMIQNNFILQSESKYCITYKNEYDQIIKYHLSCSFPEFLTDEIISDIVDKELKSLVKELGLNPNTYTAQNVKDLVKLLKDESKSRTLPDNVVDQIQELQGQLKYKFDASVVKSKIDNMLMSLVNSRVVRQYMNGDSLVQGASSGFEQLGIRKVGTNPAFKFFL